MPLSAVKSYGIEETGLQAAYCKHIAPGSPNRLTHIVTIVTAAAIIHTNAYLAYIKGAVQWTDLT